MKINLLAPINSLGYGYCGLNILKAMSEVADVTLFPIGEPQVTNSNDYEIVNKAIRNSVDVTAPSIKIWHQHDMSFPTELKGLKIGYPIFELDTFTALEMSQLSQPDTLYVSSHWAKSIVEQNGITTPTEVVPLGVDNNIFKPLDEDREVPKIFFNCGKWEVRKGHDVLIEMWDEFCKYHGDWELWMMCQNPFNTPQENRFWEKRYDRANIKLIPRVETHEEVYKIMSQVGCGIFPSRAEGWNLELLELMSIGIYSITTDYSAHTQFCDSTNSLLIDVTQIEPAFDNKWFFGQGNWARIGDKQKEDFVKSMLDFANYPMKYLSCEKVGDKYGWDNTARNMVEYVEILTKDN